MISTREAWSEFFAALEIAAFFLLPLREKVARSAG
jgi:hypothetical protein